jgi:hypothetical protein
MTIAEDSSGERMSTYAFTREMGLTREEFFKSLPQAIAHREFTVTNGVVRIEFENRAVTIELGQERMRSIALLTLPYMEVRFTFLDFSVQERERFMERFNLYFRRGGG